MDDTAAMREVLTRRFRRLLEARRTDDDAPEEDGPAGASLDEDVPGGGSVDERGLRSRRRPAGPAAFAYAPNLLVVDGGGPQVNAAAAVLTELGIHDVALVGLAKRLEEAWLPGEDHPLVLPRSSEGLYLLQRVRDEAHRFAVTFHRKRRSAAMTASVLDGIPGLGQARRRALLRSFGSVKKMRAATAADLQQVPGIGPALAVTIRDALAGDSSPAAHGVNVTTGEVLD